MNPLHAKSPCCAALVSRFGHRRRQCKRCGTTWRIRKKILGRKPLRPSPAAICRYLRHETPSMYARARVQAVSEDRLRARLQRSRTIFLQTTRWPRLPWTSSLVVLADAMVCRLERQWYTCYFILFRKPNEHQAVIIKPLMLPGTETWEGWQEAFGQIPLRTLLTVAALVCDGHIGLVSLAQNYGWLLQRCHFHLIARLHKRRSKWFLSRHGSEGRVLYALVRRVLTDPKEHQIYSSLKRLAQWAAITPSRDLRTILRGFIKHYDDYRTYLTHPELHLPRTNNATESLIGMVQALRSRARGFRTKRALTEWIYAMLKLKRRVTCNGYVQPN